MSGFYTEADYESSVIELFQNMGCTRPRARFQKSII